MHVHGLSRLFDLSLIGHYFFIKPLGRGEELMADWCLYGSQGLRVRQVVSHTSVCVHALG